MPSVQTPPTELDRQDNASIKYLGNILDCRDAGDTENDIREAFRDFALHTGIIADEREIKTEVAPATGSFKRVDMYTRNTYIEFKRNLIVSGRIDPDYTKQLDGYLLESAKAGMGVQNGILTDRKYYLKRNIGESILPIAPNQMQTYERSTQGPLLKNYLFDIINTDADNISPSPGTLTKHLAGGSDLLEQATALLKDAHDANRDNPTVAVKRKLWQDLLEVALGQDSTGDPDDADWLFIRHTYRTTLIALILQAHFGIDIVHEADHAPAALLNGDTLHAHTNLKGVSDLFQWPTEVGATQYIRSIARKVAQFNWSKRPDELAAILYQNTITPEERRKMGEYYTPRWLAQTIVQELITDPQNTVAMDPACGSGTFIECLVRNIIDHSQGQHPVATLRKLQTNVIGIDLHPVAVQLAKATWVLNSHEVINAARYADHKNDIAPPIYLGDSLQLRYERNIMTQGDHIALRTTEKIPGETDAVRFQIPMSLARESESFDRLMLDLAQAVFDATDTNAVLDRFHITDTVDRNSMNKIADQMRDLQAIERDHVWAYYLRNMVRPAVIAEQRVDAIVGNPPWLTYSHSADIVRAELVNLSQNAYGIWAGGRQAPHQDVATLFFSRVTDLYLKPEGNIGMVLPHSVLRSGQHLKWRSGYWQSQGSNTKHAVAVDFSTKTPYDLDNLEPNNFFPIASAVVFARGRESGNDFDKIKRRVRARAPGHVEIWRGPTDTPQVTRHAEALHHDDGKFHSPYADIAMQGPTIVDRRLFFVSIEPNMTFMAAPNTFKTYPRKGPQDKKKYDIGVLEGNVVHSDNLFDVYLGESIAPFVTLPPLTAALPVDKPFMTLPLDHSSCPLNPKTGAVRHAACVVDIAKLDSRMQTRWNTMSSLWDANKGKNDKKTLYQRLNYHNILTSQLEWLRNPGDRPVRIAYTTSGEPTATLISDDQAVLDTTLYQATCRNLNEAYYLLAIINSNTLRTSVDQFMPKGLFGARHLHKHLWKLHIPAYDANDASHTDLSRLGKRAATEAEKIIANLETSAPSVTKTRSILRHQWQPNSPTTQQIETAVHQLLS